MRDTNKTGHLAWCALIALHIARMEGLVCSEPQENLFITRWFAQAKKQRRFSREVAADIEWIMNQGKTQGVRAGLRNKLDYLWRSCTGEPGEQNDLFRLTYALELAAQHDWVYHVLDDKQWSEHQQIKLNPGVNSIFMLKSALDVGFSSDGKQLQPVAVRIGGQTEGLNALLRSCGWEAVSNNDNWQLIVRNLG